MSTRLKYPYEWGKKPVNAFVEKYSRGTYFLGKLMYLSPGEIRHYLVLTLCSGHSIKYQAVKRVIKTLEGYEADEIDAMSEQSRKLLYKYLLWFGEDDVLDEKKVPRGLDSFRN